MIGDASERKYKTPRYQYKLAQLNGWSDSQDELGDGGPRTECFTKGFGQDAERKAPSKIDLSPCYICHRKPSELRHLDAYADCENCQRRVCFICIRQCEGFGSNMEEELLSGKTWVRTEHKAKVCSRCCVERGSEGDVWCLGCLRAGDGSGE